MNRIAVLLTILACLFVASCGNAGNTADANANAANADNAGSRPHDSIEEFSMLANFPFALEEVLWENRPMAKPGSERVPTQNERKIVAVIRFSEEDTPKFIAEIEKSGPGKPVEISSEEWFPPELRAQSDVTGSDTLSGTAFSAQPFMLPPFTEGRLIKVDGNDSFVLEMFSK